MCTKVIHTRVLIDAQGQYPRSTSLSTLDYQSVLSQLSVDWLISIDQKLVDSWLTVDRDVDGVLINVNRGVDGVVNRASIQGQLRVLIKGINQGYWSRVLIDIRLRILLVHIIWCSFQTFTEMDHLKILSATCKT